MISESDRSRIRSVVSGLETLRDVDVTAGEESDCVVSFSTTFGGGSAYDLLLSERESEYRAVLLTSTGRPLMGDSIEDLDEDQVDSLIDHVVETIRELEGD